MTTDGKKWHYLAVKSMSKLLRGIISNHFGDSYCLNFFHSYSTKIKLKKMKEYVMIIIIVMQKCRETPAVIYADLDCLLQKMHSCQNNHEKC